MALQSVLYCKPSSRNMLMQNLQKKDAKFSFSCFPNTFFRAKNQECTITFYKSGKLLIQAKALHVSGYESFIREMLPILDESFELEKSKKKQCKRVQNNLSKIGVDESGKGDYFGPLCIAGVFANEEGIEKLKEMGVCDSKKISPFKIKSLAIDIQKYFQHYIICLLPKEYNEKYEKEKNLNYLLADCHAEVIYQLHIQTKCNVALSDQFSHNKELLIRKVEEKTKEVQVEQKFRGEEDIIVAAASILARNCFVENLELLSKKIGDIELLKGSSDPAIKLIGKEIWDRFGETGLHEYTKYHFKTTEQIKTGVF